MNQKEYLIKNIREGADVFINSMCTLKNERRS